MDRAAFRAVLDGIEVSLSDAQIDAFALFEDALYEANKVMNLTRVSREDCYLRHFVDSLLLASVLDLSEPTPGLGILDIGSGPGFPAWPLACAFPHHSITALDSSGKMLGFLAGQPLPNLSIVEGRAEDLSATLADRFDVVTGRALAPLAIQLELSARPCRLKGRVVPMRTPADAGEIERLSSVLGLELDTVHRRTLPVLEAPRVFPVYVKKRLTPRGFPRPWADIKRQPL